MGFEPMQPCGNRFLKVLLQGRGLDDACLSLSPLAKLGHPRSCVCSDFEMCSSLYLFNQQTWHPETIARVNFPSEIQSASISIATNPSFVLVRSFNLAESLKHKMPLITIGAHPARATGMRGTLAEEDRRMLTCERRGSEALFLRCDHAIRGES